MSGADGRRGIWPMPGVLYALLAIGLGMQLFGLVIYVVLAVS